MGTNDDIEHLLAELGDMRKICRLRDSITLVEAERLIRCQQNRIHALQRAGDTTTTALATSDAGLAEIGRLYRVAAHAGGDFTILLNHLANLFPETGTLFEDEES